jgi:adenosylhomocysteinase
MYHISRVIPIPYSAKQSVVQALSNRFDLTMMDLEEIQTGVLLKEVVAQCIRGSDLPLIIFDIGGYFSHLLSEVVSRYPGRILGVVEETEAGHRKYSEAMPVECPVVSVARSSLKAAENRLVGAAVAFSAERILRDCGRIPLGMRVGVLGYGNVGQPLARALQARGMRVSVDDVSEIRRCWSICDGYDAPGKEAVLGSSEVIVGVTGSRSIGSLDMSRIPPGVFLMSGSSKRVEFDVDWIFKNASESKRITKEVSVYILSKGRRIALVCDGEPINFSDRAELAHIIALVHAELMAAAQQLTGQELTTCFINSPRIMEVPTEKREQAAGIWLSAFASHSACG